MPEPDPQPAKPRILAVLPIPCGVQWGYWYRDLGLIVRTLREMGHDAWLVTLRSDEGLPREGEPVIAATKEQLEDPAWWKSQNPGAVILNLWGASRWEGIRAAAREATPHLLEKLDTSGTYTPRLWFGRYLYEGYWQSRGVGRSAPVSALREFFRACLLALMPSLLDKKRVACLSRVPVLAAESPIAAERTKLYLRTFGGGENTKVVCIPHPVDDTGLALPAPVQKENRIVTVGRWETFQKNFPLLIEVLARFLAIEPSWSADVLGNLPADAQARLQKLPPEISGRIRLLGSVQHAALARHYHLSKIFLMSSRHESFNIAAAEALCCGCSVAGPAAIASVPFFTGLHSGTAAKIYSADALLDALNTEAAAWADGKRDPAAISEKWKSRAGAKAVALKVLEALGVI